jgi:sugar/nucleoside kinase (ribokinase family)
MTTPTHQPDERGEAVTAGGPLDLVCFSYLAEAQILHVNQYPAANHGAVITSTTTAIAGDGPLTATTAATMGLHVGLIANRVGADKAGQRLLTQLAVAEITHDIPATPQIHTPQLIVVADHAGTRTWFARLHQAHADLREVDLQLLHSARVAYIDCYQILTIAAARAITAADSVPLLLNLGGDPLNDQVAAATYGQHIAAIQTNLDEADAANAEDLANDLFDQLHPDAAIVTVGRFGALVRTPHGVHRAEAAETIVNDTTGAGAAFSAGYAHALLAGAPPEQALQAGCRAGTAYCAGPPRLRFRTTVG